MKRIVFDSIPDVGMEHIVNGYCETFGYQDQVPVPDSVGPEMQPNPESREQFALRLIKGQILQVAKDNAIRVAQANAAAQIRQIADAESAALSAGVVMFVNDTDGNTGGG